ncbi:MAG: hypothetical protein MUF83_17935 [Acidimicrobiales bacterium]|nr:hypothetical protein [Acidimicrobiales bacterium]
MERHRDPRGLRRGLALGALALLLIAPVACGDDEAARDGAPDTTAAELGGDLEVSVADPARCEVFDAGGCLLPFPSDHFTRPDDSTPTGLRVALDPASMPRNAQGTPIDPTEWNRNDGFSPGSPVVLVVPGVDLAATGAPGVTDIGRSLDDDSPVVIVDAETGERWPLWAELDAGADPAAGERQALLVRPARTFTDGHRYVVALRNLRTADGSVIEASPAFTAYRDRLRTEVPELEARRPDLESVFATLADAGIARDDLYLAWDFTVASTENLTGRAVAMRDGAFEALGDGPAPFTVTETEDVDGGVLRVVRGTFTVPSFLTGDGGPGTVLDNGDDPDGIPAQNGTIEANFTCVVPTQSPPGTLGIVYGHGLLGSAGEVEGVGRIVSRYFDTTACATDFIGMSSADVGAIATMLADLSGFRIVPDRLQQSYVHALVLSRLLSDPEGFGTDPAFQNAAGQPLPGPQVEYVGASQGGIQGGALAALSTDWTAAVLVVPASNYSTLLDRSIDWDELDVLYTQAYPDPVDRQLGFALIQMLWDRGEGNGYANHVTRDPLPGAATKDVLLVSAFGDHQVANVATDVLARTFEIPLRTPGLADGRSADVTPFWGLAAIEVWPREGSAYLVWDFGTPTPPTANIPNRAGEDPHGMPASVPAVATTGFAFLRGEPWADPCVEAQPCQAPPG